MIENENTFKRNPGFGGVVTDEYDNPIEGYTVEVRNEEGTVIGTAVTDEDGYYFIYYKHKGRPTYIDVYLYDNYGTIVGYESVFLKANKFAEVNFHLGDSF